MTQPKNRHVFYEEQYSLELEDVPLATSDAKQQLNATLLSWGGSPQGGGNALQHLLNIGYGF